MTVRGSATRPPSSTVVHVHLPEQETLNSNTSRAEEELCFLDDDPFWMRVCRTSPPRLPFDVILQVLQESTAWYAHSDKSEQIYTGHVIQLKVHSSRRC